VHQLLKLIYEGKLIDRDKAKIWLELLSYCYIKPRADVSVQMQGIIMQQEEAQKLSTNELIDFLKQTEKKNEVS
jgi:hypothetical protein